MINIVKNKTHIYFLKIFILVILILFIFYLVYRNYGNTINLRLLSFMPIYYVVASIVNYRENVNPNPRHKWFGIILLITSIASFILMRPRYTYNQGAKVLEKRGFKNIRKLDTVSVYILEPHIAEKPAYIYRGIKGRKEYYLQLDLDTNKIIENEVGKNSYLDNYFEEEK